MKIIKFLGGNNQQTRVLTYTEQQSYSSKATPVLRDVAILILETGMRPEEVYTLRPENVDCSGPSPGAARKDRSGPEGCPGLLRQLATF